MTNKEKSDRIAEEAPELAGSELIRLLELIKLSAIDYEREEIPPRDPAKASKQAQNHSPDTMAGTVQHEPLLWRTNS